MRVIIADLLSESIGGGARGEESTGQSERLQSDSVTGESVSENQQQLVAKQIIYPPSSLA